MLLFIGHVQVFRNSGQNGELSPAHQRFSIFKHSAL